MAESRPGNGKPQTPEEKRRATYRYGELVEQAGKEHADTLAEIAAAPDIERYPLVQDWLFPGAWVLVGRPKIGKSWLQLQLMLAIAEGSTFLGYQCAQAECLALFGEDDNQRIKERMATLGVATVPDGCHVFNRERLIKLADKYGEEMAFRSWLGFWLSSHPKVRLVLIDTEEIVRQIWRGHAPGPIAGSRVTEVDYGQTAKFDQFALQRHLVISLANHSGKLKGKVWVDPHELINRSYTAVAGVSGSMVLADPQGADPMNPEQIMRVFAVRGRDVRKDLMLAVHQDKDLTQFVSDGPYYEVRQTQLEAHILTVLDELMPSIEAGAYVSGVRLANDCGISSMSVQKALNRMVRKGHARWKDKRLAVKTGKGGGYRLDAL
jgi:hypothetical protein